MMRRLFILGAVALAGCAGGMKSVGVKAPAPEGFAVHAAGAGKEMRALSPDGVLYSARALDNEPVADLAFWKSALKTRMSQAGYRVLGDSSFATAGADAALLKLAAPLGQKDYLYFVAISVRGKKIWVVEAAGEAARFHAREAEILKAMAAM